MICFYPRVKQKVTSLPGSPFVYIVPLCQLVFPFTVTSNRWGIFFYRTSFVQWICVVFLSIYQALIPGWIYFFIQIMSFSLNRNLYALYLIKVAKWMNLIMPVIVLFYKSIQLRSWYLKFQPVILPTPAGVAPACLPALFLALQGY